MSKKKKKKKVKIYKPSRKRVGGLTEEEMFLLCNRIKLNRTKLVFISQHLKRK